LDFFLSFLPESTDDDDDETKTQTDYNNQSEQMAVCFFMDGVYPSTQTHCRLVD